ncbi:MAG: DTW domain-containing protein [Methylobacteriaceae bacterium]|nr:DTW domain-containing protein [Methylobacteriaceae bacterium]
MTEIETVVEVPVCPHCAKPPALCVCEAVEPVENRVAVLILQHPQEQDRLLGTARLAARQLSSATFKIGLSWSSLAKALGRPAEPADWAVLHLGSVKPSDLPPGREVAVLDRKGVVLADQDSALKGLKGIVVFDGTWAQAKTLWWRNAWVLKAKRLALAPKRRSLYGELRREPRRESLSTIEAIGLALSAIEGKPEIDAGLRDGFATMLMKYREAVAAGDVTPQAPKAGGDRRRKWRGKRG